MVSKQHGTLHYNASEITAMGSGMGSGSGVVPVGGIIMWSGLLASIPAGWHLCDGDAGTPDLQSKFVKGAAAGQNPGATGGGSTYSHSSCSVAAHSDLSHSGGAVSRGTAGVTLDQHAALTHAGTAVGDHSAHVHSGSANHTSVSSKQGSSSGNVVTTNTHGNTGNPTATLTHSVTQPNNHSAWSHTVTEPNAGAGHDHGFTQPSDHSVSAHIVTQAADHTGVEPPFYALAFIMRTS